MAGYRSGEAPDVAPIAEPARTEPLTAAERVDLSRMMLGLGYSEDQVITWLERPGVMPDPKNPARNIRKEWTVSRLTAKRTVAMALESVDGEVAAPKNRKQARTRSMLTMMFQRAARLAMDDSNTKQAAQLINAAVGACDKIARIDGSYAYDGSLLLPSGILPASPEEAVRLVAHAQALVELAQRRGVLQAGPVSPPVIDAVSSELEPDDEPGEVQPTPSGDAN